MTTSIAADEAAARHSARRHFGRLLSSAAFFSINITAMPVKQESDDEGCPYSNFCHQVLRGRHNEVVSRLLSRIVNDAEIMYY